MDIFGAGPADNEPDTDPDPFANRPTSQDDTPSRCSCCGRDLADTIEAGFYAGRTATIRALRLWLAKRMTPSQAIAVAAAFVRTLPDR